MTDDTGVGWGEVCLGKAVFDQQQLARADFGSAEGSWAELQASMDLTMPDCALTDSGEGAG